MNSIKIKSDNGEEKEYEVLFHYITSEDHKEYVVYTDFTKDENNIIKCYSSILESDGHLTKITDEEQIKFIESTISSLADISRIRYQISRND